MDFKSLMYFVSAAETLNFSKTAEQYSVTQTAISLSIAKMEHELGFLLFDRSSRPMILTEAGDFFYARAKKILKNYQFSATRGKEIDEGFSGTLKVIVPSMFEALLVMEPFRKYQENRSGLSITFTTVPTSEMTEYIALNKADAAICCSEVVSSNPDITSRRFLKFTYCIALYESHPLAKLSAVAPEKLAGEPFVALQDTSASSEKHTSDFCRAAGLDSGLKIRVTDVESLVFQVGMNNTVGLIPDYFKPHIHSGIVCRNLDVPELPQYQLALCYRRGNRNQALQRLYFSLLQS